MNRLLLFALTALAFPALGTVVTLSTGASCEAEGFSYDGKTKNVTIKCKEASTPAPTPAPTPEPAPAPTPQPAPAPSPAPAPAPIGSVPAGCEGRTPPSYVARGPLEEAYSSHYLYGVLGVIYSYPLPKLSPGTQGSGYYTQADMPQTPTELGVEYSIAKCPGDMNYYKDLGVVVINGYSFYPCGGKFGTSASLNWAPVGSFYQCAVPDPGPWYLNVRYTKDCPLSDPGCPVVYTHGEY